MASQRFSRILSAEIDGRTQNARYRQDQFRRLQSTLIQHEEDVEQAVQDDSGHPLEEVRAEICLALNEIRTHYSSVSLEADLEMEYRVAHGQDNVDGTKGAGIVYIVPTTHTLFYSVMSAMSAAMAAGNCIIVELTKTSMAVPALLRKLLPEALDADTFAVSEERPDDVFLNKTVMVLQQQTGRVSNSTIRLLKSPVTARTVAVVDRTANVTHAADSLASARFAFGGRSPYSPDIVLVHEFAMRSFVEAVIQKSSRHVASQNSEAKQTATAALKPSPKSSLLDLASNDPGARVLVSGSDWGIAEIHDRSSALLKRKIDGKILLLHPFSSLDDAIDFSSRNGTLAATYTFAAPPSAKYLSQYIDAHIAWVNHVPTEMLIGAAYPANTLPNGQTRYSTDLFQVNRPQVVSHTRSSELVGVLLNTKDQKKYRTAWREALAPLPSSNQKPGWKIGFFEQGIVTGGVITIASLVAVGYYTFSYVRRLCV